MTARSGAALAKVVVGPEFGFDHLAWQSWLDEHINPAWRPGEWNAEAWLFTGDVDNRGTALRRCAVSACPTVLGAGRPGAICRRCGIDFDGIVDQDRETFLRAHVPNRRTLAGVAVTRCSIVWDGVQCTRHAITGDLCTIHYNSYRHHVFNKARTMSYEEWATTIARPFQDTAPCLIAGCTALLMSSGGLCTYHYRRWSSANRNAGGTLQMQAWTSTQAPYLGTCCFSLAPLPDLVRREVLYGLQHRDQFGQPLSPVAIRHIIQQLPELPTLVGQRDIVLTTLSRTQDANAQAKAREICWSVQVAFDAFHGIAPTDKDDLDLRAAGLKSPTRSGRRVNPRVVDLTAISQPWLRALLRQWVDIERPHSHMFNRAHKAISWASPVLAAQPGGGIDPATLRFADATAILDGFRTAAQSSGELYSSRYRRQLLGVFWKLVDFGRSADLLDLAGGFTRHASHTIPEEDVNEDEIGSAVPESVIRQLDAHQHLLGLDISYGHMPADAVAVMCQTIYIAFRDTGRRTREVASLPLDCLETTGGDISLVWDNSKSKRLRRRLPITTETAESIISWQRRRALLDIPHRSRNYLFPAITAAAGVPHINTSYVATILRSWVASIPELRDEGLGLDGNPLPFERSRIYPYAFRHSYAQRHADAGTPVDVLSELMDHASISTTMDYYQVSLKRKREAVTTMAIHSVDRSGRSAPFGSDLAYERGSVAVPYGNCVEPSNVKAGGQSCPIRFQCAGCGFYRPDPSFLPAIEQHINELRADREIAEAMDAAEYVISNLTEQIGAYREVVATMRYRLAQLPSERRAEVDEACAVLRKVRAGSRPLLPLTVVTPTTQTGQEDPT
ncbi:tyrosine-type recombinase/integrase [Nonomuraea aridisoli]|uniref:Transposase n=1 Tax=Nonomuraea aridisoli TaxID=2070368 RepID=A0A2W2EBN4_9ACTN|nr:site-specific integrase [Nonomuraea aridisoli]PZG19933.1 transposase [Nonomuraea aridisoli]